MAPSPTKNVAPADDVGARPPPDANGGAATNGGAAADPRLPGGPLLGEEGVTAWEERIVLPTLDQTDPEPLPIFDYHNSSQGNAVAYPFPAVVESMSSSDKTLKTYTGLFLENRFLRVLILPELGARVHMAYDKIQKKHFICFEGVVKPEGCGGGIQFHWPRKGRRIPNIVDAWTIERVPAG